MVNVLFVESDVKFSNEIKRLFVDSNYVILFVKNNQDAYLQCKRNIPDVVFLSDQKEIYAGMVYLKLIRELLPDKLILILGDDFAPKNIIPKLNNLADSYISRSIEVESIFALMESLLQLTVRGKNDKKNLFIMQNVYLDMTNRDLVVKEERISLALQEFLLLEVLIRNLGDCVPKAEIYKVLWDREALECADRLRKLVYKCSHKLKSIPEVKIKTLHSYGYMLCLNNN